MTVGERIKKLRKEKGLTQTELGELLGVKKAAVQKYESGQVQNLKQSTITKLCEIFNRHPGYFVLNGPELEKQLKDDVVLIETIQNRFGNEIVSIIEVAIELNDTNKNKVVDYINDLLVVQSVKCADNRKADY